MRVVQADALSLRLPDRPFRVVASPPYTISSPLLRALLAPGSRLVAADLVLQRAFRPPPHVDSAVLVVRRHDRHHRHRP